MVSNALVILLQCIIRDCCVGKNILIVSFNVIWSIIKDSHHPKRVDPIYGDLSGDSIGVGVDWSSLMEVLSAYAHLSQIYCNHTGLAATDIQSALLPDDENNDDCKAVGVGLSEAFHSMFCRTL